MRRLATTLSGQAAAGKRCGSAPLPGSLAGLHFAVRDLTPVPLMKDDERLHSIVELVRRIRHDANGPLTVALGHVQLLLGDAPLDPDVEQSLTVVEAELRRLIVVLRGLDAVRGAPDDHA